MMKTYYWGVDLVRFLAATFVVWYHIPMMFKPSSMPLYTNLFGYMDHPPFTLPFNFGWLGVEIFFVISGVVIFQSAAHSTALKFAIRRFLRLAPAMWIAATITLLSVLLAGGVDTANLLSVYVRSLLFVPVSPWIDGVYWTLGIEIVFYALVAVALFTGGSRNVGRLIIGIGLMSMVVWLATTALSVAAPDRYVGMVEKLYSRPFHLMMVTYGSSFALGATLVQMAGRERPAVWQRMFAGMMLVSSCCAILAFRRMGQDFAFNAASFEPVAVFVAVVAFIWWALGNPARNPSSLTMRVCRVVGLATYPLYLVHEVMSAAVVKLVKTAGGSDALALAAAGIMIMTAVAFVLWLEPKLRSGLQTLLESGVVKPLLRFVPDLQY